MKRFFLFFILSLLVLFSLILVRSFMDILHYRNAKLLTIQKISDQPFPQEIPVVFRGMRCRGPYLPVQTNDGQYGMFADKKENRLFFYAGRTVTFGIVHVTYEVTNPDFRKQLFEIYNTRMK